MKYTNEKIIEIAEDLIQNKTTYTELASKHLIPRSTVGWLMLKKLPRVDDLLYIRVRPVVVSHTGKRIKEESYAEQTM